MKPVVLNRRLVSVMLTIALGSVLLPIGMGVREAPMPAWPKLSPMGVWLSMRNAPPPSSSGRALTPAEQTKYQAAVSGPAFIENKGQWPEEVLYLCRLGGLDAWITKWGMAYNFFQLKEKPTASKEEARPVPDKFERKDYELLGHGVYVRMAGASATPRREGREALEGYYNYFIGNDPSKWATDVRLYREVWVKGVYEGIDMRYYTEGGG